MDRVALLGGVERRDASLGLGEQPFAAELEAVTDEGRLLVRDGEARQFVCEWLDNGGSVLELSAGERLLILPLSGAQMLVAIGRIGRYQSVVPAQHLKLEASESLTLLCGESSIDLRADGKVLIKGDDVTVRAKGVKRIRAGSVSIN